MNLRTLAAALATLAALLWALASLLGPAQPWVPFLTPLVLALALALALALVLAALAWRRAIPIAVGLGIFALAGALASAKRLDITTLVAAFAWLASAECAAASVRARAGDERSYLRAAAPLALAAAAVALASAALPWIVARVAPASVARSLDVRSPYAAFLAALLLTLVAMGVAWALQRRAPRAQEAA